MGHGLMDWSGIDGFVKDWHWIVGLLDCSWIGRRLSDRSKTLMGLVVKWRIGLGLAECCWMGPLVAKSSPVETLRSVPIVHLFEGY